ncbi:MAG: hypothetical protein HRU75_11030 [Planctomycetia bacterium]|nr:MAG: hypothetical protein HRU75_11030 [Planctomycetia bacterium]
MRHLPLWLRAAILAGYCPGALAADPTHDSPPVPFSLEPAPLHDKTDESLLRLRERLGPQTPTGAGVIVGQSEPFWQGGFMPFVGTGVGEFAEKFAENRSSLAPGISPHARTVGTIWFGRTAGVAPGIPRVACFEAADYVAHALQWESAHSDPALMNPGPVQIINASWVYDGVTDASIRALRRLDHVAAAHGVLFVSAVHNSRYSNIPTLMASMYNGIAVGRADGDSSHGPTFFEGHGRAKPEIVADSSATSYAAPRVAGAAALLIEQAGTSASRTMTPLLLKAVMLTAARKPPGWFRGDATAEDDSLRPLDWRYGAGTLRIDRNHEVLAAGPSPQNARCGATGWSCAALAESSTLAHFLFISTTNTTLTATACWNRHHSGDFTTDAMLPLNRLTLELWRIPTSRNGVAELVQSSASPIDNLQHIHVHGLAAGDYVLRVVRHTDFGPESEPVALAWHSEGVALRGDMNGDGRVTAFDLDPFTLALFDPAAYRANFPGINPLERGDTNYDGEFDLFDIDSFIELLLDA